MKNRKKQDNATAQSAIYVGFVDTPGLFASIIRRVIGQELCARRAGLRSGIERSLQHWQAQSGGYLFAGFERENREKF